MLTANGKGKNTTMTVIWAAVIVGLLLLATDLRGCGAGPEGNTPVAADPPGAGAASDLGQWQAEISEQSERILSGLKGAGTVRVWVQLGTGPVSRPVRDEESRQTITEERDAAGGSRMVSETQSTSRVSSQTQGLTWQSTEAAVVSSAVVVATGASDPYVKSQLHRATMTLLGLPAHRVIVLPGGGTQDDR